MGMRIGQEFHMASPHIYLHVTNILTNVAVYSVFHLKRPNKIKTMFHVNIMWRGHMELFLRIVTGTFKFQCMSVSPIKAFSLVFTVMNATLEFGK